MFRPDTVGRDIGRLALAFLLLFGLLAIPLLLNHEGSNGLSVGWSFILAAALALLSAIDLQHHRLPDVLTLPLLAAGLVVSVLSGIAWWSSAISAALGFALLGSVAHIYRRLRKRAGLGLGDAKLFAASGAWVGGEALPTVLLWATSSALLCVLAARWWGRPVSGATRLPFGPFLAFATWLVWLYGPL